MANRNVRMYNPTHRFDAESLAGPVGEPHTDWSHKFQEIF